MRWPVHTFKSFKFKWSTAAGFDGVLVATVQETSCFGVGSVRVAVKHGKGSFCAVSCIGLFQVNYL